MENQEVWRPVVGYEGLYEVSSLGNVKSLQKIVDKGKWGVVIFPKKTMKKFLRQLYYSVNLYKNKKGRLHHIHRLVATAFLPNEENKAQVNHKNGIKTDNRVENLEWTTPKENTHHAINTGIFCAPPRGEKNGQSKLSPEDVIYIRNTRYKVSRLELSKKFNVSIKHIDRIRCKERWKHVE